LASRGKHKFVNSDDFSIGTWNGEQDFLAHQGGIPETYVIEDSLLNKSGKNQWPEKDSTRYLDELLSFVWKTFKLFPFQLFSMNPNLLCSWRKFGIYLNTITEEQPHASGRFKHSAIIQGIRKVYFNDRRCFGNLASCPSLPLVSEKLTDEAVAQVCVVV